MKTKKISHLVMMGDSLTDRGTMNNRYLFGFIPMRWLSGLAKKSPTGRFTNGFAWSDGLSARIISQFIIEDFRKNNPPVKGTITTRDRMDMSDDYITGNRKPPKEGYKWDITDTSDAVLFHENKIMQHINKAYNLHEDEHVRYQGLDFLRNYVEGGLTAHNYTWTFSHSISRFFSRLILSTLDGMREKLLDYDKKHAVSMKHKAETLVLEWSGANDLITVNQTPSKAEVDNAIQARMENINVLIKNGYRNFVLFNLPDLSLTPRFQNGDAKACETAQRYSVYFNQQLQVKCQELQKYYPHCSVQVYDINYLITKLHANPEKYGFETSKLNTPYVSSPDFVINENATSPSKGYMFFDDVHPTADVHAKLAARIYDKYKKQYAFTKPEVEAIDDEGELQIDEADLLYAFRRKYEACLKKSQSGFFGKCQISNINYRTANITDILRHALLEGGSRTRAVITELQWIDKAGNIYLNIPALKNAMIAVNSPMSLEI